MVVLWKTGAGRMAVPSKKKKKQELIDHVESLVAKCAELTKERDDARQEVCIEYCDRVGVILCGNTTPQDYAKRRGWDCFKENTDE